MPKNALSDLRYFEGLLDWYSLGQSSTPYIHLPARDLFLAKNLTRLPQGHPKLRDQVSFMWSNHHKE